MGHERREGPQSIRLPGPSPIPDFEEEVPRSVSQRARRAVRQAAPQSKSQWVAAVAMILTAMGGGAGIREALGNRLPLPPPALTKVQADELLKRDLQRSEEDEAWRKLLASYLWQLYDAQVERAKIHDAVLCRLNQGKEFARKVECGAVKDWDSIPLGQEMLGPYKAQWDYPVIPKPPVPRPTPKL